MTLMLSSARRVRGELVESKPLTPDLVSFTGFLREIEVEVSKTKFTVEGSLRTDVWSILI